MSTEEQMQSGLTNPLPPASTAPGGHSLAGRHFASQADRPSHLAEVDLTELDAFLRTLLFTDGTVTRTLEAQTLRSVSVEVVSQDPTVVTAGIARHLAIASGMAALRRRVNIGIGETVVPVIWAESHIVPSRLPRDFLDVLDDANDGIGGSLQQVQLESWREMLWFGLDQVPAWSGFGTSPEQTAITRLYRVIVRGRPALLISETFTVRRWSGVYHLDICGDQTEPNSFSIS